MLILNFDITGTSEPFIPSAGDTEPAPISFGGSRVSYTMLSLFFSLSLHFLCELVSECVFDMTHML